jgi:myo-inositol-1(or 4)-monophosphatase
MTGQALAALLQVATEAADLARAVLQTATTPSSVTPKEERDMVTAADYAVERRLREFLAVKTPNLGFLGEEEGPSVSVGGDSPFWVLDPIDGTANYARGVPLYAVSLGLVQGGHSVVAVIDLPSADERFEAVRGGGARLNGSPIHASGVSDLSDALVAVGDYAVGANAAGRNRPRLELTARLAERVQRVRMLGSAAIDLAWVACGRLDASVMLSNKPWDTTAGALIAQEAGAVVQDLHGTTHSITSETTIAVNPHLRPALFGLLHDLQSV